MADGLEGADVVQAAVPGCAFSTWIGFVGGGESAHAGRSEATVTNSAKEHAAKMSERLPAETAMASSQPQPQPVTNAVKAGSFRKAPWPVHAILAPAGPGVNPPID